MIPPANSYYTKFLQFLSKIIIKYIKDVDIIKKLPKIYQNSIDKKISNNKELYYSAYSKNDSVSNTDIDLLIDGIFNNKTKVYNIPVIINTSNKSYETY